MKYLPIPVFLALVCVIGCKPGQNHEEEVVVAPELVFKWKTDTLLTTCESVIYDDKNNSIYVSSMGGNNTDTDGNGFISKVSLDGTIEKKDWITGLNAPKGLGIYDGKLYVADIDRIVEIDISAGAILNSFPVTGAEFLNDLTIASDGKVYVSDSNKGWIVLLDKGQVTIWRDSLVSPNGLLAEDTQMLVLQWDPKTMSSVDWTTKQVELKADSIENPDGVEAIGNGDYLVSSWNGKIHYVFSDGTTKLLLDTSADSVNAADIDYVQNKNLLLIPGFFKNEVIAYELKK